MVPERAVRKQQDTSHMLAGLSATAAAFNAAVAQCILDAAPEAVHQVRTGSRRLQAVLETTLRAAGPVAKVLEQPARAWLRELKKMRRAAGPVRDLDVHRKLLEHHPPAEDLPGTLRGETEMLDQWLREKRKHLARGMRKQMEKHRQRSMERQCMVFVALSSLPSTQLRASRSADAAALHNFVRACDAMPSLNVDNLHDFRKATKKARYVAEAGTQNPPHSPVAKTLKRVQDAIGEWHDWQCLAMESARLDADVPELTAALQRAAERHFAAAMQVTESGRGRLLGEWTENNAKAGPVRAAGSSTAAEGRKRA